MPMIQDFLPSQDGMVEALKKHDQFPMPNQPPIEGLVDITKYGENVLWVTFIIMLISTLVFFGLSLRVPKKARLFYNITGLITTFAFISYYCMATGYGEALVPARGHHAYRVVLTARYADWAVTTPLLLLDLTLLAGMAGSDIFLTVIADLAMIATGILAATHPSYKYRWGLFAFSCAFLVFILYELCIVGYEAATRRHTKVGQAYIGIAVYTAVLWAAYPIVWAFGEGTNIITADSEVLGYAVLDVLAKPVFGTLLVISHDRIAEASFSMPDWWVKSRGAGSGYTPIASSD